MKHIITILMFVALFSCSQNELSEGGLQELGLETTEIISEAQDTSFVVKIENPYWYLYKTEEIVEEKSVVIDNTLYWKKNNGNTYQAYHDTMSGNWFEVSKNASNSMVIKMKQNFTQCDRKLLLYIAGNEIESDILTVIQRTK